jgi:CarD family transcriptional regulator
MHFNIGEKVVYPNYGVGTVENISTRSFGRQFEKFYLLRIVSSSMTVMVPFSHVEDVGLRKVTQNGQVEGVLEFLANGDINCCQDWKNRFKENTEKMQRGALIEVAEVLKGLLRVQARKTLSFREKKMLDRARHMLITEVAASQGLDDSRTVTLLDEALSKASLRMPPAL